jgi:hypothetical protein
VANTVATASHVGAHWELAVVAHSLRHTDALLLEAVSHARAVVLALLATTVGTGKAWLA